MTELVDRVAERFAAAAGSDKACIYQTALCEAYARQVISEIFNWLENPSEEAWFAGMAISPMAIRELWPNGEPKGCMKSLSTKDMEEIWQAMLAVRRKEAGV